MHFIFTLKVKK